jgi:hypothetical protein
MPRETIALNVQDLLTFDKSKVSFLRKVVAEFSRFHSNRRIEKWER